VNRFNNENAKRNEEIEEWSRYEIIKDKKTKNVTILK